VVSGLIQHFCSVDFVSDNVGCFASGGTFPRDGRIVEFGSLRIYIATVREP
jgi:hypothetical protein